MEGTNYWRLRRFSLFYKYYAFVDTEEYLGDQLFIQQKVEVSFGKEFGKKGNDYLIIFCKVRKKDEKNFLKALDELEKKMLLMGHHDYCADKLISNARYVTINYPNSFIKKEFFMGHHTQYIVSLSQEEKNKLQAMSKDNKLSARVSKRVLILLALDDKKNSNLNHRQIASALNTTVTTIVATARDYFQNGLEHAISHHYNPSSLRPHKVNGELEAHVLQLACGEAPDGYSRWTLELLTEEVNKKGIAEPVSKETIRVMLKKMNFSLTGMNTGASRLKKMQHL